MEITVWTVNGVPARLVWGNRRYKVNDIPTRLSPADIFELTWHPAMTHPLPGWSGWRFQAEGEDGRSIVFDVREGVDGGVWSLLRTWDYESGSDSGDTARTATPSAAASSGASNWGSSGIRGR